MKTQANIPVADQFNIIRDAIEAYSDLKLADNGELTDTAGQPIKCFSEEQDNDLREKVAEALSVNGRLCLYLDLSNNQDLTCLDFLRYCIRIRNLKLVNCQSLVTLRGLEHLKGLQDLALNDCIQLECLWEINELTEMFKLDISGCSALDTLSLSCIGPLEQIRYLKLNNLPSLYDIESIYGFSKLKTLELFGCECLESLEGIQGALNLQRLSISDAPLTDLSPLKELPKLFYLSLEYLPYLMSLDDLPSLRKLRYLTLSGLDDECDTSAIQNIRKCCEVEII